MCNFMCVTLIHVFFREKTLFFSIISVTCAKKGKVLKTAIFGAEACCCSHAKHPTVLLKLNDFRWCVI